MEVSGWFIGAGIGTVFTVLYEGVKQLAGRHTKYKAQLEALELTLESFDLEVIQQLGRHNEAMCLPNEDVRALEQELNKGVRIIGELSDACLWNRIDSRYMSQLVELNRSLSILERRLKLQAMRDVKETRHMMQILLIRLTLSQEPGRDIGHGSLLSAARLLGIAPEEALHGIQTSDPLRNIASSSTALQQYHGGNGEIQCNFPTSSRLPDIAPQEALHHIIDIAALDPVRNIASTSTDLRQFHGSGEIQEVGSSSDHLPYPQENSNFRGSDNQLQRNDGQLVTTSDWMVKKIVVKQFVSSHVRYRSKAFRLAGGIEGAYSLWIDLPKLIACTCTSSAAELAASCTSTTTSAAAQSARSAAQSALVLLLVQLVQLH